MYLLVDANIDGTTYTNVGGTADYGSSALHQVWFGPAFASGVNNHWDIKNIKVGTGGYGSSDLFAPALTGMSDFGSWVGTGTDPTFAGGVMSFNNSDDRYGVHDFGAGYNEIWVQFDLYVYSDNGNGDYTDVADSGGSEMAGLFDSGLGGPWYIDAAGTSSFGSGPTAGVWTTVGLHYKMSATLGGGGGGGGGANVDCAAANTLTGVSGRVSEDNSSWSGTYNTATDPLYALYTTEVGQRPYWWTWTNTFSEPVSFRVTLMSYDATTPYGLVAGLTSQPCGSQNYSTEADPSFCTNTVIAAEGVLGNTTDTYCGNKIDLTLSPGQTVYLEIDAYISPGGDTTDVRYGTFTFDWQVRQFVGQDGLDDETTIADLSADLSGFTLEDFVELNGRLYTSWSYTSSGIYTIKLISMLPDGTDIRISEVDGTGIGAANEYLMTRLFNVWENKVKFIYDGTYVYAAIPSAVPHDYNPDSAMGKNGIYTNCNGTQTFHPATSEYTYIPALTFYRESGGSFNYWWRLWQDTEGLDPAIYPLHVGPNYGWRVEVGPSCSVAAADGVIYAHICWIVYRKFSEVLVNHWGGQPGPCDGDCEEIYDSEAYFEAHAAAYKLDVAYLDANPLYNRPDVLFDNQTKLTNFSISSFDDCTGPDYLAQNPTYTDGPWATDPSYVWQMPLSFANTKELVMIGDVPFLFYQPITSYTTSVLNQSATVNIMRLDTGSNMASLDASSFSASGVFLSSDGQLAQYGTTGSYFGAPRAGEAACLQVTEPQSLDPADPSSQHIVISTDWGSYQTRVHRMDPSTFTVDYLIPGRPNSSSPPQRCWAVYHDPDCNQQWYGHDDSGYFLIYDFCNNAWSAFKDAAWSGWFMGAWINRKKYWPVNTGQILEEQIVCDVRICTLGPPLALGLLSWQRF
jgi:hypothetical protein